MDHELRAALSDFRKGKPILLFDSPTREGEVDMVVSAVHAAPGMVALARRDAGGLICVALSSEVGGKLGLPYADDILRRAGMGGLTIRKTPYGDSTAFSAWVNSRKTFTGITDADRSETIREIADIAVNPIKREFAGKFYSPGHVPLLVARPEGKRRGHTELSIKLAKMAGMPPAVMVCEMLDSKTHGALALADAGKYAKKNGLHLICGEELESAEL
ncbi:3,4-dihydroxy-2-butanone-4-phosphate synthase [Candidatus Micrarchaeota archaeon]|nr:3,4-dihydroxy-2-butanone-4-phosphate synthase [Candidatus Micrarchaeota archaeon]